MEYKYLEKQEKSIEKKEAQMQEKARKLLLQIDIKKLKDKYQLLEKEKKSGHLNWEDEVLLDILKEAIKVEEKKL